MGVPPAYGGTRRRRGGSRRARPLCALVALLLALVAPAVAGAAFPGPVEDNPRTNTPNDPDFDRCEPDDPDTPTGDCSTYFEEQSGFFGFSPESANMVPAVPHSVGATRYVNCDQLDGPGRAANLASGDPECAQISGVRADSAWKYSTGDPETVIAILDTGIEWQNRELADKIALNEAELPLPQEAGGAPCGADDCNADGSFDVRDYADDPRVADDAGDTESDAILDGSDLIAAFSDGTDADSNGFVDDIAGWDFFDDDNDPFDASSCCSAGGHGTDRALSAAAATNNGQGEAGMCPDCQIMPLRVWDTFVLPTDFFAMGTLYAARNGASVVEGAVGGLTNTRFAREVFEFADSQGVALTLVSSDINSANHNYPTNYNEAIYVAGSLPDTAPNETCTGPGDLPVIGNPLPGEFDPPPEFREGCDQLLGRLAEQGVNPYVGQPITTSFFRNSNLTQYGGKADIVMMGPTGSEATGQASGAAGLLAAYGRETFGDDDPLTGNEIRQLLTMTAEDVMPENTGTIGQPDRANEGWDTHFGYGRVNLAAAMKRIADDRVPPEAQIDSPDWFTPINVDRVDRGGVAISARAAAPHSSAGVGEWELEYACGQDAADADFQPVPGASGTGAIDGVVGTLSRELLIDLAANCDGSVTNDAGRPAGLSTDGWPANPYPDPDPERHAFQIRFTVHEAGDPANFGRYRKTLFAYSNDGNLDGWPKPIGSGSDASRYRTGSGGEAATRLYDVNGDNALDVVMATSSGELHVLGSDGRPLESFNGGEPVRTEPYALANAHPSLSVPGAGVPRESLRIPAIGDIDGDREPEIVASAGERVYAWEADGSEVDGFPVSIDRSLSEPCVAGVPKPCFDAADRAITSSNHIKRGIFGSVALADLDADGRLDITSGAMDQHLYAWNGEGEELPGFPVKLDSPDAAGAEIVNSPAIAELDGDATPEIVVATNEVIPGDPAFPTTPFDLVSAALAASTGANPVYAVNADGTPVPGWPVGVGVAAGDLLPLVLPGHDAAVLDTNGDGIDEVSVSAGTSLAAGGGIRLVGADGQTVTSYQGTAANSPDQGAILNLADYPAVGDLTGLGTPSVIKGGLTLNGVANLLAVNQNLPFSHVIQAWDAASGAPITGFPRATDDFQLVSQPAVARVGGTGPGAQALYGTGLYQLHAYGVGGLEPAGWPKFTGGWTQATPSVGDADGDGDLDVSALTREGWSFLWDTGTEACGGSNDEWWTFHHDEFGSANYGTDARPPGTPESLAAARAAAGSQTLSWKAPGDDWLCGEAATYEVRVSPDPIQRPSDGTKVDGAGADAAATGETETLELSAAEAGNNRYAAVLYRDDAGNWGRLAQVELEGGPPGPPGPGPAPGDCETVLRGTGNDDELRGTAAGDRIAGGGGDDEISSLAGSDCVGGGGGDDDVRAGADDDDVRGSGGEDSLRGSGGADTIRGNGDDDVVRGNGGGDTLRAGAGADRVKAGGGDDEINVLGGGRDRVACGAGRDAVKAGREDRVNEKSCERVKVRRG